MIDDPSVVFEIVAGYVVAWISKQTGINPDSIDPDKTLRDDPNDGYGLPYVKLCNDCVRDLSVATGRDLTLDAPWRRANASDTVSEFIGALVTAIMAAPPSASGMKASALVAGRP